MFLLISLKLEIIIGKILFEVDVFLNGNIDRVWGFVVVERMKICLFICCFIIFNIWVIIFGEKNFFFVKVFVWNIGWVC